MTETKFVSLQKISKSFSGVKALREVSLDIDAGTVHGLIGENGAGKSTLMKILSGSYTEYEGRILLNGKEIHFKNEKAALDAGISIVPQELNPISELTIAENIFLGRQPELVKGFISYNKLNTQTTELMRKMGLLYNPETLMSNLSIAETQMIEISKAISRNSKLIIMDEPTSALTDAETKYLFTQIKNLKEQGIAIIFISHKLDEIFKVCDNITVLRDGRGIGTYPLKEVTSDKIITMMVGRKIEDIYPEITPSNGDVVFNVKGLTRKNVFENISFNVKQGEIVGIAGIMGAGRTEVARAIFGMDRLDSGEIFLENRKIDIRNPREAIKNGIVMVSEDRKQLGLVGMKSVKDNIALPNMDLFAPHFFINEKILIDSCDTICKTLSVKTAGLETPVQNLSGGNQQKIVLAKWLVRNVKLLIMDEPTRGIDVGAKCEIYRVMKTLSEQGIPIIMISSELPEIIGMSHRVLVMAHGKIQKELLRKEASQQAIMQIIVGGTN